MIINTLSLAHSGTDGELYRMAKFHAPPRAKSFSITNPRTDEGYKGISNKVADVVYYDSKVQGLHKLTT